MTEPRKIATKYDPPPIPWRGADWTATFGDYDLGDPIDRGYRRPDAGSGDGGMSLQSVAQRVAAKVYFWELANSRALRLPPVDCYVSALRAQDEAYAAAFKPDCPAVHLPWRWIRKDS